MGMYFFQFHWRAQMKKILVILYVIIFNFPVHSQYFPGTGQIYTNDSEIIEAQDIFIKNDSIVYHLDNYQTRGVLGLEKVNEILWYNGTYWKTGAWIGLMAGVLNGVIVVTNAKESGSLITKEEELSIMALPLVYGLVGLGIGSLIQDWETVYSKNTAFLKNINIKQESHIGLAVSYRVYF